VAAASDSTRRPTGRCVGATYARPGKARSVVSVQPGGAHGDAEPVVLADEEDRDRQALNAIHAAAKGSARWRVTERRRRSTRRCCRGRAIRRPAPPRAAIPTARRCGRSCWSGADAERHAAEDLGSRPRWGLAGRAQREEEVADRVDRRDLSGALDEEGAAPVVQERGVGGSGQAAERDVALVAGAADRVEAAAARAELVGLEVDEAGRQLRLEAESASAGSMRSGAAPWAAPAPAAASSRRRWTDSLARGSDMGRARSFE
jgi:hypothetical protein